MRILLIKDGKKVADTGDGGLMAGIYTVDVCHDGQSGREATEAFNYAIQLRVENKKSAGLGLSTSNPSAMRPVHMLRRKAPLAAAKN